MTKWEYASTVAASLAYLLALQQDAPGVVLFDHEVRHQSPTTSNRTLLSQAIEQIEATEPDRRTDVKVFLRQLAERWRKRGMVILISDLLADLNDVVEGLRRFRFDGHEVIVIQVLDRDELEFPFTDHTLFEGLEEVDLELLTDPQSLRQSYLEAVQGFVRAVRGACVDQRIDYVLMSTADPLDAALTGFLSRRMHMMKHA
jgi:uncharacterized protein (DUF58 family)